MKIAYSPFADPDLLELIGNVVHEFHAWTPLEKFDKRIRTYDGTTQPLKDVKYNQQLYVFGHGGPRETIIEDCLGNSVTIKELAARIAGDGLSISHEKIKLYSCSGGVGGGGSMAAQLKNALRLHGYTKLSVYGFTESMTDRASGVLNFKRGESGARAKNIRVKF